MLRLPQRQRAKSTRGKYDQNNGCGRSRTRSNRASSHIG